TLESSSGADKIIARRVIFIRPAMRWLFHDERFALRYFLFSFSVLPLGTRNNDIKIFRVSGAL
ncbi:hypothetical protein, partial [Enterococcus faecium]